MEYTTDQGNAAGNETSTADVAMTEMAEEIVAASEIMKFAKSAPATEAVLAMRAILTQARTGDPESWDTIRTYAPGCSQDYFAHTSGSIRVEFSQRHESDAEDEINVMKEGVMVMVYDMENGIFERKLMKVDDQLRFMYLIEGSNRTAASKPLTSVQTIPLSHIRHVYTLDEAMHICEDNGLKVEAMEIDSTFCLYMDPNAEKDKLDLNEGEMPEIDKVLVLMAAPQQRINECIHACKDWAEGTSGNSDDKPVMRVDQVQIQDTDDLLSVDASDFKYDVSFRGHGSLRTILVFSEICDKKDLGGLRDKLAGDLLPVDLSRVYYVIQDSVYLRRALHTMASTVFVKKGIINWMQDMSQIHKPMPEHMGLNEAIEEIKVVSRILHASTSDNADDFYNNCSARACMGAFASYLNLEHDFVDLAHKQYECEARQDEDEYEEAQTSLSSSVDTMISKSAAATIDKAKWRCRFCKYINYVKDEFCQVCDSKQPSAEEATAGQLAKQTLDNPSAGIKLLGTAQRSPKAKSKPDTRQPPTSATSSNKASTPQSAQIARSIDSQGQDTQTKQPGPTAIAPSSQTKDTGIAQGPPKPKRGQDGITACAGGGQCKQQ